MAYIEITGTDIGSTSSTISCGARGFSFPSSSPSLEVDTDNFYYSWSSPSSKRGKDVSFNISSGAGVAKSVYLAVSFYVSVRTVTVTITQEWVDTGKDEDGNPTGYWKDVETTTYGNWYYMNSGSASDTIIFYTKPSRFNLGAVKGGLIGDALNESNWKAFMLHVAQYVRWRDQSTSDYAALANNYNYSKGTLITSNTYNSIADYLGVSHVSKGDLIAAQDYITLQNATN